MASLTELPTHLREFAGNRTLNQAGLNGLSQGSVPRVSIKGNRFALVDGAEQRIPIKSLDFEFVIIGINAGVSKQWYEGAFDPSATEYLPPTCASSDGVEPDAGVAKPQNSVCSTCPRNAWGSKTSAVSGKATKECQDGKDLAVLAVSDDAPGDMLWRMRVPPASMKALGKYLRILDGNGANANMVVTRASFVDNEQGTLEFQAVEFCDADLWKDVIGFKPETVARITGESREGAHRGALTQQKVVQIADQRQQPSLNAPAASMSAYQAEQSSTQRTIDHEMAKPDPMPPAKPSLFGSSPPAADAPPKRHRRTKAEIEAARAAEAAPVQQDNAPPAAAAPPPGFNSMEEFQQFEAFKRSQQANPAAVQASFGIAPNPPLVTDPALSKAISDALTLP